MKLLAGQQADTTLATVARIADALGKKSCRLCAICARVAR